MLYQIELHPDRIAPPRRIELPSSDRQSDRFTRCVRRQMAQGGPNHSASSTGFEPVSPDRESGCLTASNTRTNAVRGNRTPIPSMAHSDSTIEPSPQIQSDVRESNPPSLGHDQPSSQMSNVRTSAPLGSRTPSPGLKGQVPDR